MPGKLPDNVVALLQSLIAVGENPNLHQTAQTLKISRHTLKNRLKDLEELVGYPLLELGSHNQYVLTAKAEIWLQEVMGWLQQGEDIFTLPDERVRGLIQSSPLQPGEPYYSQQHPMSKLWEDDTPYLRSMLSAWLKAKAEFHAPSLKRVRDNAIMARLNEGEFIIMGIGKNAAMQKWLGREWCLSAIGKPLSSTAMSTKADKIVTYSYHQAIQNGSPWYDHVSMELPRPIKGIDERAYYRRLILPCKLPDGSPVVASVVELSDEVEIGKFKVRHSKPPTPES